ncbi:Protein-tyrosine phosphatase, receptor/non-receptor type domain and Protein-tyrosine/Dual specificity phosphatase domain and Protein-tyrosine phosphatase, catalytic domain-containing protein [Strongyloides ratti]|uniref:Protein-tyrosine phosphatase, receptor/non-receptor type domain and Protein-tyrosine/Dual specificity phosphatase domain and Protein-tyrosine phosphatase, catalytic domain-containing protein n=1 Tax=Strongyloides ratti TaxID=34506 RepID=A0A090LHL5_STRRB|nr:Protein-tyrosine phosphatase, receptor/non-receptor type domain and Protein-tyrosine/Dual specificity phosphatase domain and Protein-tyrosine phosphatase, catalytic domain-containing protein [Strongyloides ratti]CEF69286.1 Protein-tyrosine phosphatase, receptor/non-receptor type domain and Protein-tyrosine/Dual specificity phosphatase domain and Protein-tyrosine phosphatase, catalytic domain-containing protein [Strongyloides ratti]
MEVSHNTTRKPRTRFRGKKKNFDSSNDGNVSVDRDKTFECEDEKEAPFENAFKHATIALTQGGRKNVTSVMQVELSNKNESNKTLHINPVQPTTQTPPTPQPQSTPQVPPTPQVVQPPIQELSGQEKKVSGKNIADLAVTFVDKLIDEGLDRLKKEFTEINRIVPQKNEITNFLKPENALRNRNINVPCIDSTRVELTNYTTDYIHANYVGTLSSPKRFICTQSPTTDTVNDFWFMIAQHDVSCIGMISDMSKGNKDKLELYFPNKTNRSYKFGEVKVTCKKRERMSINSELRRTTLKIQYMDKKLDVLHYHWAYFPDKSVPTVSQTPFQLLGFLRFSKTPIVLHDALGTGRVGILCLIEMFMECLMKGKEVESLQQLTESLKKSRAFSLEYEIHYFYIHSSIIDYLKRKINFQSSQLLLEFIDSYDNAVKKYEKTLNK